MTPLNASPTNQSSSNSTTPPSETTLADDMAGLGVAQSESWSQFTIGNQRNTDERPQNSQTNSPTANNSELESSAAEDFDAYTIGKYENAEYALLSYSRTNKFDKLQTLLEAKLKGDINLNLNFKGHQKQNFSWSALHLACYFGHIRVVEYILSKKQLREEVDVNIQNNSGDTPLHKATLTNRVQIVQILLSNKANVFIKNCDGLLAKQLTNDKHILEMLEAAEQVDKNRICQDMFKAVDNGDLTKLQEYFKCYDSFGEAPQSCHIDEKKSEEDQSQSDEQRVIPSPNQSTNNFPTADQITQMTDERGNTLLHLATMRGFKAICIYLLEQGSDPYKKNLLGQSCIDLASYQLRQLFATVKPADSQLKRLSKQRVIRFEGPLLKKVRILGWKQIYVVLENGVILLFNNRRDSMNKSRRGYKYLESASCEPDPNDVGTFTVCFSDRSRATFLVNPDHLSHYTTFKTSDKGRSTPCSQVELIRQRWIDSIRDHIVYSTEFIRKGLKFDDDDNENYNEGGDLSNLNHLLPIDIIKSFMHEARAHYSILERHAQSLCNLVQSINSSNNLTKSIALGARDVEIQPDSQSVVSSSTTGSRLLGFIRPRPARASVSGPGDDGTSSIQTQQALMNNSMRIRDNSLMNEFIQDNWPCILFHLRLLMESTENTKMSMGQALALMEHQEQLRQNRIQDQDERCRVLEDSLHALARDHHELEKSISMSQIYHSAAGRSMSMSTDLNEYHDAFEDFDDEKTMTPNSLSSDEELDKKIQDVMNEEEMKQASKITDQRSSFHSHQQQTNPNYYQTGAQSGNDASDDEEEDDDLRSNCSALTVETITEQYHSAITDGNSARDAVPRFSLESQSRTQLPSPMVPRDQVSIWSILKNCIGKELSKITMPVVFNEPLTMLQRACEGIQYSHFLKMADLSDDPVERMELVCAFIIASLSVNCHRIIKPFNPLLYETYEYDHELQDGSHVKAIAQQVSHHPPITAAHSESENFTYNGVVNPKIKFWGRSIEIQHDGNLKIYLKRHKESYVFKAVPCSVHNIIVGKLWFEHHGPLDVKCLESNLQANLVFKQAGWFSNDLHRFDGFIVSGVDKSVEKKKLRFVYGKWSDYVKSVDYSDYEKYMNENQQKLFKIPDNPDHGQSDGLSSKLDNMRLSSSPNSINNNSIPSESSHGGLVATSSSKSKASLLKGGDKKNSNYAKGESQQSLDIPNSKTLWRLESQYLNEYYNFTLFTMRLNELTPELAKTLPRTDSRFRPDVRKLEEGDLDAAASEKQRLEEKQREARARDKRFKEPSADLLFFEHTKEKFWIYKGDYWENKCNPEKFPDLF